jgi:hypothetical protein
MTRTINTLQFGYIIHLPAIKDLKENEDRFYTTKSHRVSKEKQASFRLVMLMAKTYFVLVKLFIFATNTVFKLSKIRLCFVSLGH